jgi:hypothetical protein
LANDAASAGPRLVEEALVIDSRQKQKRPGLRGVSVLVEVNPSEVADAGNGVRFLLSVLSTFTHVILASPQ